MHAPTAADVERARHALAEDIRGPDPDCRGSGELSDGEVRHLLAEAAYTVVAGSDPATAFANLNGYLDTSQVLTGFGQLRAALILEMLLYQCGWTEYSTWNSLREQALRQRGTRPDGRWVEVCSHVESDSPRIHSLAGALRDELSASSDSGAPHRR